MKENEADHVIGLKDKKLSKLEVSYMRRNDANCVTSTGGLAGVTAKHQPLSIIVEGLWKRGEVPEDWRKASVTLVFKKGKEEDPGNYRPVSFTSIPGKLMEELLKVINKHVEEKKVIGNGEHGFTKGKSCLGNLIAFCDGMTSLMEEGRAVDVVYLDFSKAFDTVSHKIPVSKLRKCGLDEWTMRWIENWLNGRAQGILGGVANKPGCCAAIQ
ncbi:mitochondrial enolase superfamily member 1 [Grus japonensis]|uniref:Mitochondrial enolase superfamily member 1 n=1 Tax=Grus japonensis TaxID=30415 RepID=A0ABC9XZL7_GRUJA